MPLAKTWTIEEISHPTAGDFITQYNLWDRINPVIKKHFNDVLRESLLKIPIDDNTGFRRIAYYRVGANRISLHRNLLGEDKIESFIHEFAHAIVHYREIAGHFKDPDSHGREWQHTMLELGAKPEREAKGIDYLTPSSQDFKHFYKCVGCGVVFGALRSRDKRLLRPKVYHRNCIKRKDSSFARATIEEYRVYIASKEEK